MKKAIVFQGGWEGHEPQLTSKRFAAMLEKNGIRATVRRRLGADINASCGQLRREDLKQNS